MVESARATSQLLLWYSVAALVACAPTRGACSILGAGGLQNALREREREREREMACIMNHPLVLDFDGFWGTPMWCPPKSHSEETSRRGVWRAWSWWKGLPFRTPVSWILCPGENQKNIKKHQEWRPWVTFYTTWVLSMAFTPTEAWRGQTMAGKKKNWPCRSHLKTPELFADAICSSIFNIHNFSSI